MAFPMIMLLLERGHYTEGLVQVVGLAMESF